MMKRSLLLSLSIALLSQWAIAQEYFTVTNKVKINHDNTKPKPEDEVGSRFDMIYKRADSMGLVETEIMVDPGNGNRVPNKLIPSKQSASERDNIIYSLIGMSYSSGGKAEIMGIWVAFAEIIQRGGTDNIQYDVYTKYSGEGPWVPGNPQPVAAEKIRVNSNTVIESNPDSAFHLFEFDQFGIEVSKGDEFLCSVSITDLSGAAGAGDDNPDIISVYSTFPGTGNKEKRAFMGISNPNGSPTWERLDNIMGPVKDENNQYVREAGKFVERPLDIDLDFMIYPIFKGTLSSIRNTTKISDITYLGTFPNPAQGFVNFNFDMLKSAPVSIKLMDVSGRVLKQIQRSMLPAGVQNIGMDLSGLNSGNYIYMIESNGGSYRGMLNVQ